MTKHAPAGWDWERCAMCGKWFPFFVMVRLPRYGRRFCARCAIEEPFWEDSLLAHGMRIDSELQTLRRTIVRTLGIRRLEIRLVYCYRRTKQWLNR